MKYYPINHPLIVLMMSKSKRMPHFDNIKVFEQSTDKVNMKLLKEPTLIFLGHIMSYHDHYLMRPGQSGLLQSMNLISKISKLNKNQYLVAFKENSLHLTQKSIIIDLSHLPKSNQDKKDLDSVLKSGQPSGEVKRGSLLAQTLSFLCLLAPNLDQRILLNKKRDVKKTMKDNF
jgi:hypothetical protein